MAHHHPEDDCSSTGKFPPVPALGACLADTAQPLGKRTHAAFYLRTIGGADAVDAIAVALRNRDDSALLRHELGYILGQMQDMRACTALEEILADTSDDVMVRHEAAEALGAIGAERSVAVLTEFARDAAPEVSQTCQLALDLIGYRNRQSEDTATPLDANPYLSIDPAPSCPKEVPVEELRRQLLDASLPLFARYRAMFSLRNRGTEDAVLALSSAFQDEPNSLFKHEVAYVLGQMAHVASVPALSAVLKDTSEHRMVRHEAAEALGAIGGAEAEALLAAFAGDDAVVVKESCEVALNTIDYWKGGASADGIAA
ncbi:armadillo-type protein [Tribonema minus]|uniref:Deoxyhypusine hydroxylase n=1 Tax=Tribonema minus TaxID=303371 RepID=A0A835ZDK9_9STRA|nr:armadillo-type protein [Tribonema minus]